MVTELKRSRLATTGIVGLLLGCGVFALFRLIPQSLYLGGDFRVFYSAALLARHGISPYGGHALLLTEQHVRYLAAAQHGLRSNFTYLPIVAWVLIPLTYLPFWTGYVIFSVVSAAAAATGVYALARTLNWSAPWAAAMCSLVVWCSLWTLVVGQWDSLILAAVAGVLVLRVRSANFAAGLLLTVTWVKPQLLLPLAPLVALTLWPHRREILRLLGGLGTGTAVGLVVQVLVSRTELFAWWSSLQHFARGIPADQGSLAGIEGLIGYAPAAWHLTDAVTGFPDVEIIAFTVVAVGVVAVRIVMKNRPFQPHESEALMLALTLPLGLWLAGTPYDHINDLTLLIPLAMVIVGPDALRLGKPLYLVGLVAFQLSTYVEALVGFRVNLAPWGVLAVCVCGLWLAAVKPLIREGADVDAGTLRLGEDELA